MTARRISERTMQHAVKKNKIERLKERRAPYAFREKIAQLDLANLSEDDRFYLKNYGIYNSKLRPETFMLRIRVDGGRVTLSSLETIVSVAKMYRAEIILTARAQLELHGLRADNVLEAWQQLQHGGIGTLQVLTDNFRAIVTDPFDGVAPDSQIEVYPLIRHMSTRILDKPEWMGMIPRKFNTAICATATTHTHFFGNDLYFALARKEGVWGFNLYLGGKNSETAKPADLFVLPDDVPDMFMAVAEVYREYGLRGTRAKTRMFHLIEAMGMEAVREKIVQQYGRDTENAGELSVGKRRATDFTPLQADRYAYCLQSRYGKIAIGLLEEVIAFAAKETFDVRIGVDQNLYLIGLESRDVPFAHVTGASEVTACAGSRYCALSLWDIKSDTAYLPLERIEKHGISVGFSGCLKGCGRHHHCDIGLVGLRTNAYGETQKAARIFLGGIYSRPGNPARLIFGSVPLKHLRTLLDAVIDTFEESEERDFETFCERYLNPHTPFFVMLWFLSRLYLTHPPKLEIASEEVLYQKLCAYEDFPHIESQEPYLESIRVMMHALWDD